MQAFWLFSILLLLHVVWTWRQAYQRGARARQAHRAMPTRNDTPLVSILIPAWREGAAIARCLHTVQRLAYPRWEALVIAGGGDDTLDAARAAMRDDPRFRLIEQLPRGKNAALNQGLALAGGEVIAVLDADALVAPDWLTALIAPLTGEVMATTGNYLPEHPTLIGRCEQAEKLSAYEIHGSMTLQGSGGIALTREAMTQLGQFAEGVRVGVDWDLNLQAQQRGWRCVYCPQAVLTTDRPATLREFWRNEVRWRRAHLHLLLQHRRWLLADWRRALNAGLFYAVALAVTLFGIGALIAAVLLNSLAPLAWLALLLIWLMARRAALAAEIASYQQTSVWFDIAPMLGVLLLLSFGTVWRALWTLPQQTAHFRASRHARERRSAI